MIIYHLVGLLTVLTRIHLVICIVLGPPVFQLDVRCTILARNVGKVYNTVTYYILSLIIFNVTVLQLQQRCVASHRTRPGFKIRLNLFRQLIIGSPNLLNTQSYSTPISTLSIECGIFVTHYNNNCTYHTPGNFLESWQTNANRAVDTPCQRQCTVCSLQWPHLTCNSPNCAFNMHQTHHMQYKPANESA